MKEQSKLTLMDIANCAGVSIASVSRVLNNSSNVSPYLVSKINKAIDELNYKPLIKYQKSSSTVPLRIGLLVPDITAEIQTNVIKGILEISRIMNVQIILYEYENDSVKETTYIKEIVESGLDGIISILALERLNTEFRALKEKNFPFVLIINSIYPQNIRDDMNIVRIDDIEGTYNATKYLIDLGHKKILYLGDPNINRFVGYKRALNESSLDVVPNLVVDCENNYDSAYSVVKNNYDQIDFSSIIAVSDNVALGGFNALKDLGLSVPQDCSIVGYSNSKFADFFSLTTIAEPLLEIGKNAMLLLHKDMQGIPVSSRKLILRDSLVIRNSCRKI